ncbi:ATP-binding cassette domain-containing protein [Paracoccus marinaquae]|uniref:ATP-binding cassette domain-containing protein n=1 Tax=Paracoccus marinaquae TaxID=2841926 RepID=A0ABS6ADS4_9RHOB|nr:ATP-binding cassette domain-containing protein [Paracoccus marinaquae]MBU3028726.1 ATP-binding cassette domain-containing protein [Paracoccus marinaquae]
MKIRLEGATLGYGEAPVLSEVNFSQQRGERVVLLGPSGAGKSTLLMAIHAQLAGASRVALVPQDGGLVPQLSVRRNVYMGRLDDHGAARNLGALIYLRRPIRDEIDAILARLGLQDHVRRPVEALSGGQRQRTAVGRAFYRGGDIIVADEPVSAVDGVQARQIIEMIRDRFDTALLALHDVDLARAFATRIVGLRDGRIRFDGPAEAIDRRQIDALYA